jgi:hypothetical protein
MYYQKSWLVLLVVIFSFFFLSSEARSSNATESLMFRDALKDPTMQYLVKENFPIPKVTVACAVLSLQWRAGRIEGSNPSNPGDPGTSLLMHGMAEVTIFALNTIPPDEVKQLMYRALAKFEESEDFRESSMSVCSSLMVPMLRFVMQKNNLIN